MAALGAHRTAFLGIPLRSITMPRSPSALDPEVPVASPCVGVCQIHPTTGWCQGCLRTLDEIAAWPHLNNAQRLAVWQALAQRGHDAAPSVHTSL